MADQLPPVPDGTALSDWEDAGRRTDHTGTVVFTSPDRAYALTIDIDAPVDGYLLRLWSLDDGRDERIGQTVVDDEETALEVAVAMAAAATDLDTLENPHHRRPPHSSARTVTRSPQLALRVRMTGMMTRNGTKRLLTPTRKPTSQGRRAL